MAGIDRTFQGISHPAARRFEALDDEQAENLAQESPSATAKPSRTTSCLICTCCHPARWRRMPHVALTLREVCGLTTEEIDQRFPKHQRRRWRNVSAAPRPRSRGAHSLSSTTPAELPARSTRCCAVIYLVFNEGYAASSGAALTRATCPARRSP